MTSKRRQRITAARDAFRVAVAAARGAARRGLVEAQRAQAEADAELQLLRQPWGAPRAPDPAGARIQKRVCWQRETVFGPWLRRGPQQATAAVAEGAPGSAGDPPELWLGQVGKADGGGQPALLWRAGVGRVAGLPKRGFPVAVPLLDDSHLTITTTPGGRRAAEQMVEGLLLRVVSHYRPGLVRIHVWDTGQHAGTLPGLYPLTLGGLLTVHPPEGLGKLLEEMAARITRLRTSVLVDGHPSLRALAHATTGGERVEPWQIVVLAGSGRALRDQQLAQLLRVARAGLACGIQLVMLDIPTTLSDPAVTVHVDEAGARTSMTGPHVQVELDPPVGLEDAHRACGVIADWWADWLAREASFRDLLPPADRWGVASAAGGLVAPVGFGETNEPIHAVLDDASPHALVCGPSGSGKTNLILAWLAALTSRYGPDELELYLLDFKESVSFARLAPTGADPTWLPQARLIGVNINDDREFGLALLTHLQQEMRRRAEAAKRYGVDKLEELRRVNPEGCWPRIVAVIDEFQYLFTPGDALAKQAVALLEDVARRGRAQAIHLVLASQDIGGIQVFWGRPGVFEQFVLRVGLPRATRILASTNDAAAHLRKWHAVINHESGVRHANLTARIPNAVEAGSFDEVQVRLHFAYNADRPPPVLFDGARAPLLDHLAAALPDGAHAVVGQAISVTGGPAAVALPDQPGRNLAVIGGSRDAPTVLAAAALSLARQLPEAGVVVVPLAAEAEAVAAWTAAQVDDGRIAAPGGLPALLAGIVEDIAARRAGAQPRTPLLLALFGADGVEAAHGRQGMELLRTVLRHGPEVGVHVLGWWRSTQQLRTLLAVNASVADIGSWVALDVHGSELGPLMPGHRLIDWHPRPGRGLWFDRSRHSHPETIIVPALEAS